MTCFCPFQIIYFQTQHIGHGPGLEVSNLGKKTKNMGMFFMQTKFQKILLETLHDYLAFLKFRIEVALQEMRLCPSLSLLSPTLHTNSFCNTIVPNMTSNEHDNIFPLSMQNTLYGLSDSTNDTLHNCNYDDKFHLV